MGIFNLQIHPQTKRHQPEYLTNPSEPCGNNGFDNVNGDLILHKNQRIDDSQNNVFEILKWLGAGQFGQVYECKLVLTSNEMLKNKKFAIKISKSTEDARNQLRYEKEALLYVCTFSSVFLWRNKEAPFVSTLTHS